MNNTPKTVEGKWRELVKEIMEYSLTYYRNNDMYIERMPDDYERKVDEAITALNELKSELTKQQVVSALQQTALDHIVGGDYEDLLTKNLNIELRAEERLQK